MPQIQRFPGVRRARTAAMAAFTVAAVFAVLFASQLSSRVSLKQGDISPQNVIAPRTIVNQSLYKQQKAQAAAKVGTIYVSDPKAVQSAVSTIDGYFAKIAQVQLQLAPKPQITHEVTLWQAQVGLSIPSKYVSRILALSTTNLSDLQQTASVIMTKVLNSASYKQNQLPSEQQALSAAVGSLGLPDPAETSFLEALVTASAQANIVASPSETKRAQQQAQQAVTPPLVQRGQLIVAKGQRVTASDIALMKALGLERGASEWRVAASSLLLTLLFAMALWYYVRRVYPDLLEDESRLAAVAILTLVTLVVGKLASMVSPLLIPLAFTPMLLVLLVGARMAVFLAMALAVMLGLALNLDARVIAVLLSGSVAGVFGLSHLRDRNDLLKAPLHVGGASLAMLLITELTLSQVSPGIVWVDLVAVVAGSLLSVVLAIGILPFFETYLGILSPLKLLELSNPNQPLQKELLMHAPGTYHHSLIVSNLAVAGADAIGADALLCRVGAYYHDIGKLKRPAFFVDNQPEGQNPHDKISPHLSTLIITSHVKDGLEMAKSAHLPREISDFIAEHHGTTLVAYFYHRAKELNPKVREEDFRYEGPKPRSRETAILMLADSTEAAVRAMKGKNVGKIEGLVRKLIKDRLYDGQLDESGLTLGDLNAIAKAFVRVLSGVYHTRVEYPDLKEVERRAK